MSRLLSEVEKMERGLENVHYQWVRGHSSNKFNQLADYIAYNILKG